MGSNVRTGMMIVNPLKKNVLSGVTKAEIHVKQEMKSGGCITPRIGLPNKAKFF